MREVVSSQQFNFLCSCLFVLHRSFVSYGIFCFCSAVLGFVSIGSCLRSDTEVVVVVVYFGSGFLFASVVIYFVCGVEGATKGYPGEDLGPSHGVCLMGVRW